MDFKAYASIAAVNWSTLREIKRSPKHYRYRLEHAREDSTTLMMGRAAHTAVLEPEKFADEYAVFTGARRAGKAWEEFQAANASKTILKADEYENMIAIRDAVRAHPVASRYLSGGVSEHTVTWSETINGIVIACKARLDYLGSAIVDLKTSRDAGAGAFGRTAARFGYHCQVVWYRRGVRAATKRELPMVLVAVETDAPHDVAAYKVTDDQMWAADEEINALLIKVADCRRFDRWPGAHEEEAELELPHWALGDTDEDAELTSEVIG
jgi:hypothetical protein